MDSSTEQDRSLSGTGLSLPQWMKGRGDSRYDFDQSTFSPPSHDDNFFCIRYSSKPSTERKIENLKSVNEQEGYKSISQVLNENTHSNVTAGQPNVSAPSGSSQVSTSIKDIKITDFSKHPLPCQPFVPAAGGKEGNSAISGSANKVKVAKSQGTDDGFHSEPALCGKSIVYVASRMMSRKLAKIDSGNEGTEQQLNDKQYLQKGSKSLPVTPVVSPISTPDTSPTPQRRAANVNRYFTGSFVPDRAKYQTGWLLSSILGQSRESAMGTSNKIQEVDEDEFPPDPLPSNILNRKKSISSQNLSYLGKSEEQPDNQSKKESAVCTNVFRAKPSELREMNFWTPTSM